MFRYILAFFSLYMVQGLSAGFIGGALLREMYGEGMSKQAGGSLLAVMMIPWTWKFLLGPLVDRLSRPGIGRFRLIAIVIAVMAGLLGLLPAVGLGSVAVLTALLFAHNVAKSLQDVAVDGMAVELLSERRRGPAQTAMQVGLQLGQLAGGAGAIFLMQWVSWQAACYAVVTAIVVAGVLVPKLLLGKAAGSVGAAAESSRAPVSLRQVFSSFKGVEPLLVLAICLLAHVCQGITAPVIFPWFKELGLAKEQIAGLLSVSQFATLGGTLLAGLAAAFMSNRSVLFFGLLLRVFGYAAIGLCSAWWGSGAVLTVVIALSSISDGFFIVALYTFLMKLTRREVAASQYAVFMAAVNLSAAWTMVVGGWLGERMETAALFTLAGFAQAAMLLPLVLLLWWQRRKAAKVLPALAEPDSQP